MGAEVTLFTLLGLGGAVSAVLLVLLWLGLGLARAFFGTEE